MDPSTGQVGQRVDIAQRLAHLFGVADLQPAIVQPETREMSSRGRLALRYFIFVMRKDVIFAAGMNINLRPKEIDGHGRALQVPARYSDSPWAIPPHDLVGPGAPPYGEIGGRLLSYPYLYPMAADQIFDRISRK